jgi:hypothetical protein
MLNAVRAHVCPSAAVHAAASDIIHELGNGPVYLLDIALGHFRDRLLRTKRMVLTVDFAPEIGVKSELRNRLEDGWRNGGKTRRLIGYGRIYSSLVCSYRPVRKKIPAFAGIIVTKRLAC